MSRSLPPSLHQEEYGREYYDRLTQGAKAARGPISWRKENITQALAHAVTAEKARPYAVVGIDGRFMMGPLLLLPRR